VISYKMARRSFLRACGGSTALLVPLLRGIEARAQGMPAPLRFLVIHRPCGTSLDLWRPAVAATTKSYTLPTNSAPFAPLQSNMVMVDGLNLICASEQAGNGGGQNTSEGGVVEMMTGVPTLGRIGQQDHCAGGPSIDQILLARSPILGGAGAPFGSRTPFGSLQLAADIRSSRDEISPRVLSYLPPTADPDISLARQPLYPETQPLRAFNKLFGGPLPPAMNVAQLLSQKLSVLDFMRTDLARLNTLIPASEKPKLDAHAAAIQQLESRLRTSLSAGAGQACVIPTAPPMFAETGKGASGALGPAGGSKLTGVDYYTAGDPTNHPHEVLGQAHLALIQAAFLCDLVRVATFSWASSTSWVVFPSTFNGATLPSALVAGPHYESTGTYDSATLDWVAAIDHYYSDQTSRALQRFATATDIDGNTLLDNTIIPYLSEVSRRWDHNQQNMPFLVFGGKNTRLDGGTFLKVTDGPLPQQGGASVGNRPYNDAWLALAPIFGVTLPALGTQLQYTGPLPGLVS
jgi:hypothetical protein